MQATLRFRNIEIQKLRKIQNNLMEESQIDLKIRKMLFAVGIFW